MAHATENEVSKYTGMQRQFPHVLRPVAASADLLKGGPI